MTRYVGAPQLIRPTGTEPFDTTTGGAVVIEHPARRTQLRDETTTALFALDALDPMTDDALDAGSPTPDEGD